MADVGLEEGEFHGWLTCENGLEQHLLIESKIELQIVQLCLHLTNSVCLTVFEIPILRHEFVAPCIVCSRSSPRALFFIMASGEGNIFYNALWPFIKYISTE